MNIPSRTALYFRYQSNPFLASAANITVRVEGLTLNSTINQLPPRIFYSVCMTDRMDNCTLTQRSANNSDRSMTELAATVVSGSSVRIGTINHDPKVCPKTNQGAPSPNCIYFISIFYPDNTTLPMRTTLTVNTNLSLS